jgi:ribosomal protein S12 methylthiotransferase accessory factor
VKEATVHALCELVERDIRSFQAIRDTSAAVDLQDGLEGAPLALVALIERAGLELYVRAVPNVFGLPFFTAIVNDPDACAPHLLNAGYGCHLHRSVAFVRAVCEAAQSRLTFIHGGRDDLVDQRAHFAGWSVAKKRGHVTRLVARAAGGERVRYARLPDHAGEATTIERCLAMLLQRLRAIGLPRAYRVVLSREEDELQVVRVIVPGLEHFGESTHRVGARLRDHARAIS